MMMAISPPDFRRCLAASLALHLSFLLVSKIRFPWISRGPVEIDLTSTVIGLGGPALRAAPKKLVPQAVRPAMPVQEPSPTAPPVAPPKEFLAPGPDSKKVESPTPDVPQATQGGQADGTGTSHLTGGQAAGRDDYGEIDGTIWGGRPPGYMDPQLLNKDEVLRNLRRFYPERERMAGNEGLVIVDIRLGLEGEIVGVDVFQSAGPLFDKAAAQVAKIMKFAPARTERGPVRVKIRRKMQFTLTDE